MQQKYPIKARTSDNTKSTEIEEIIVPASAITGHKADLSSVGAAIGSAVSGGTAGSVLFLGAGGILSQDNARFFWDNTAKQLQLNSGAVGETPFRLKGFAGQTGNLFEIKDSTGTVMTSFLSSGNLSFANNARILISGASVIEHSSGGGWLGINSGAVAGQLRLLAAGSIFLGDGLKTNFDGMTGKVTFDSTITPGGTTGSQTINKPSGSVNFAAAASSLVVTNSLVTASSIVIAVVQTSDSTAAIKNVVPAAGSFTINLSSAATAETKVGFLVIN